MTRQIRPGIRFCFLVLLAGLFVFPGVFVSNEACAQRIHADRNIVTKNSESLTPMLEQYCEKYGLPAIGAAVIKDGRTIAIGTAGTRKSGQKIPVNAGDRFHIGSNTKAITSLLAAIFVKEGKLRWDSRLEEVFPELEKTMTPGIGSITLEKLLSHSSGMPEDKMPLSEKLFAESWTRENDNLSDTRYWMLSRWVSQPVAAAPRTRYSYSNMGYVMVGAMLEKVSGKSWEELVIEKVFVPLRLRSAGFGPQSLPGMIDAPLPHKTVDGKLKPMMAGPFSDNPLFIGPAGTVHMSLQDFARWASWNAGAGKRAPQLIPAEMFVKLTSPVIDVPFPGGKKGLPERGGYALGWLSAYFSWSKEPFVWHNGSNRMNRTHVFVQPKKDFAMVLMTNAGTDQAEEAIGALAEELYKKYGDR
jgi:CubicO group peptidase (beta-lactamase class C family)